MTDSDFDVGEEGDLLPNILREGPVGPANQHIGLDAELQKRFHAMLRRLGLCFAGGGDERNERHVNRHGVLRTHLEHELAHGFQKRKALNVADRAADFRDHHIVLPGCPSASNRRLISSVICGITWTVAPR